MNRTEYVRDWRGNPVAAVVIISHKDNRGWSAGYSICHPKDKFVKSLGRKIALSRAKKGIIARLPDRSGWFDGRYQSLADAIGTKISRQQRKLLDKVALT